MTKLQRETNDYHVSQGSGFWEGGLLLNTGNAPLLGMVVVPRIFLLELLNYATICEVSLHALLYLIF